MTVVVLDAPGGPLPPYPAWLHEADVILFSGRAPDEPALRGARGYSEVRTFDRYGAQVERAVLARCSPVQGAGRAITGIVAVAPEDAIRAGALRDHLGLPGQGRESAILFHDLAAMRARLAREAVPVVPFRPVRRVADLHWLGWTWGFPLRVRRRRASGWPELATLTDEAAVRDFARGGVAARLESLPDLVAEPVLNAERWRLTGHSAGSFPEPCPAGVVASGAADPGVVDPGLALLARAAFAALPPPDGFPYVLEVCRTADGEWLVDAVTTAGRDAVTRQMVRAQAGLATAAEVAA